MPLLAIGIAPSANVHACRSCHGIFVGARAWCTLVARPELAPAIASKLPARDAPSSELVRLLKCPACTKEMERGRFGARSNIVIDVCIAHGIWLDSGEAVAVAAAESGPHDGNLAAAQAEATMAAASIASRTQKVKRTGLIVFFALVALRVGFFIARGGGAAPPEIKGAGESAGQAATALGNR